MTHTSRRTQLQRLFARALASTMPRHLRRKPPPLTGDSHSVRGGSPAGTDTAQEAEAEYLN